MFSDIGTHALPPVWHPLQARTVALGFDMPSDARTGALLKALAASKPRGDLLELGTGTGLATACLLAGMEIHRGWSASTSTHVVRRSHANCSGRTGGSHSR